MPTIRKTTGITFASTQQTELPTTVRDNQNGGKKYSVLGKVDGGYLVEGKTGPFRLPESRTR